MKKIILAILVAIMALIVPVSFSRAFSLGEAYSIDDRDGACIVWRVGMPPQMIEIDGQLRRQSQYFYCLGDVEKYKRIYELEEEVIRLDSLIQSNSQRISVLEAENKNLREGILANQNETKQLLIRLLSLLIVKK